MLLIIELYSQNSRFEQQIKQGAKVPVLKAKFKPVTGIRTQNF